MKKTFKITAVSLLILIFLLAGSAVIINRFVDPNKFKGRISQYVYAKTGQVLVINGNMEWSLFPWLGLKANNLAYYNTSNFTPKILVSAKEMDIKLKLLPLITGQIEIGNITLNNAVLNLIKNKNGDSNWQMVLKHHQKSNPTEDAPKSNNINHLSIASLKIKNSKLNLIDQQSNSEININDLDINSKHIQFGKPFPFSLHFNLLNDHKEKSLTLGLDSDITLSPDYQQYILKNISLALALFNENHELLVTSKGDLDANLLQQTLTSHLTFTANNLSGQLELEGDHITKQPHFYGTLSTDSFNLQKILQNLSKNMRMKNATALESVSLLSKLDLTSSALKLTQLHLKVDDTDVFGNINIIPKNKYLQFVLNANQMNLDDYLPQKDDSQSAAENNKELSGETKVTGKDNPWTINGKMRINNLKVDKLKLANVVANIDMKNQIVKILPLTASLYQGQLQGQILVDKHLPNKTTIYIKQNLKGINIKDLLHEFSDSDKLSGNADISADLIANTNDNNSFLSALNGKVQFALSNGAFQGVDVIYQLSRAHAFIKHLSSSSLSDTKQTQFLSLTANATVTNGVMNTDDLALTSDYLKVTGKGHTNLVTKELHYRLNALAQPKLAQDNKEIGKEVTTYQVPIKVTGKINKPSVNLDFTELAKIIYTKQIEKPITKSLEKKANELKENLEGHVKDKLKEYTPASLFDKLSPFKKN